MEIVSTIAALLLVVAFIGVYVGSAAWAVNDAQKRGQNGGLIVLFIWMFGPLAAIVWRFARPRTKLADKLPDEYENAEDELAAASRLDMQGDWDTALTLYQDVSLRWPDHKFYAQECIRRIEAKKNQTSLRS